MENKTNNWRTATIVLVVIVSLLGLGAYQKISSESIMDFNGLKIPTDTFNDFVSNIDPPAILCDMDEIKCIIIQSLP